MAASVSTAFVPVATAPAAAWPRSRHALSPRRVARRARRDNRARRCHGFVMRAPQHAELQRNLEAWGVTIDPDDAFGDAIVPVSIDPPMLRIENFLTAAECDALVRLQSDATDESDLYLNYRVNRELDSDADTDADNAAASEASAVSATSADAGTSAEADALIAEFSSARATLSASMPSGFRAQVAPDAPEFQPVLERVRALFGFGGREFVFEEGAWRRPNRRTVLVRDQTTVRYYEGEGVAPHVDGKDLTVLICLAEPRAGGRTVFPQDGLAVTPVKGAAIVYRSKAELLHFAEAVTEGTKWVLQMLIDFRVRDDEPDVDFATGSVFTS